MINKLLEVIDNDIVKQDVPMSQLTTFRTGGNAKIVLFPRNVNEIKEIVKFFFDAKMKYYVLGNGSNLLVSDDGINDPVICLGKNFSSVDLFEDCITARAGAFLSSIARKAADASLTGFEFAAGIPGTLGGALIMNAGAYGGEMKDVVEAVSFIDPCGEEHIITGDEMEFSYRSSVLSNMDCIITGATIKLKKGNKKEIEARMSELNTKRREKQPLEYPSAGSTFKRPTGYFAGALIEEAGLKGKCVGGAQVSEKHSGFIINTGNAKTSDILELINIVKEEVYKKHNVILETEVKFWD